MSPRYKRYRRSGKQNFPPSVGGGFPTNHFIAQYVVNLLPYSPFHDEFVGLILQFVSVPEAIAIIGDTFRKRLSDTEKQSLNDVDDPDVMGNHILAIMDQYASTHTEKKFRNALANQIRKNTLALPDCSAYVDRVSELKNMLNLSEVDVRVLEYFLCYNSGGIFEHYCDAYPLSDWAGMIAIATGLQKADVYNRVVRGGSLASKGLIELKNNRVDVNDAVLDYLSGISRDFISEDEFSLVKGSVFPLDSFPVTEEECDLLVKTRLE